MGELLTKEEIEYILNRTEEDIKRDEEDSEGDVWLTFIDPDTGKPFGVCVNERKGRTLEKFFSRLGEKEKHRIINYGQKDEKQGKNS